MLTPGSSRKGKRRTLTEEEEADIEEAEKTDEDEDTAMDMDEDVPMAIRQPVFSSGASSSAPRSAGRICRGLPNRSGGASLQLSGSGGLGRTVSLPADVFSSVHGF